MITLSSLCGHEHLFVAYPTSHLYMLRSICFYKTYVTIIVFKVHVHSRMAVFVDKKAWLAYISADVYGMSGNNSIFSIHAEVFK